jgi:autotransporter-associated beta strand repeat/autotransporter-associated beta strand repeat
MDRITKRDFACIYNVENEKQENNSSIFTVEVLMNTSKMLKNPACRIFLLSIILIVAFLCVDSFAALKTWTGGGADINWSTTANWQSGIVPVNNDTIIFNSSSIARLNNTNNLAGLTGVSIQITNPGTGPVIISGNGLSIGGVGYGAVDMGAATQDLTINTGLTIGYAESWNVNTGRTLMLNGTVLNSSYDFTIGGSGNTIISGVYSGAGNIAETGSGNLTLSGANTFGGTTTLNSGTLNINNPSALGTGPFSINGGSIDNTSGSPVTLVNNNTQAWDSDFSFIGTNALNLGTGAVTINANRTITVNGNSLTVGGAISGGSYGLTKMGPGTLVVSGANTYTGMTNINGGTFLITNATGSGTGTGSVSVNNGATLGGTGSIGSTLGVSAGGTLAPGGGGTGILTINNNLTFAAGAMFAVKLNGTTAGTNFDQLVVNGTVTLAGASIQLMLGYIPTISDAYTIINSANPISGTFNGIPEGGTIIGSYSGSSYKFTVSYVGGTGNDVVLTCAGLNTTKIWTNGSGDGKWSTAPNWMPAGVPVSSDTIGFSAALTCSLDVNATIRSIKFPSGFTGPFKFLNDTLFISDSADFSTPTSNAYITPGSGAIEFIGTGNHSLLAKQGLPLPSIVLNGGGITTVKNAGFKAKDLHIVSGTFNCGPSFVDSVTGTLRLETGASLQLGTSNLWAWEVNTSAGNLNFENGQMTIYGPTNTNFVFDNVAEGTGARLNLQQTGTWHLFSPPTTASILPPIYKTGTDSVILQGASLKAQGLILSAGAWNWGLDGRSPTQAYGHVVDSILTSGNSKMVFSSYSASDTVTVSGKLDFSGLNTVGGMFAGIGGVVLNGMGTQLISPAPGGLMLPTVSHAGQGTMLIAGDLLCYSFNQTNGTLNFNNKNFTSSTNFSIIKSATTSIVNLNGSTIQATSATFKGFQSDTLVLTPGAAWTINVTGGGALSAEYVKINYCTASGSTGYANNSPYDASNTNWRFGKFWKGSGSDSLWTSAYNWLPNGAPQTTDSVVFDNTATKGCMLNASATVKAVTMVSSFSNVFNFSNYTLSVSGDANFSWTNGPINIGTAGALQFIGTGNQNFWPPHGQALPSIVHTGTGTLFQMDTLKCKSFQQTAGTYNINGKNDTVTPGDFAISNGNQSSLVGLANSNIIVWYGAVSFAGGTSPDTLFMKAASQYWVKAVTGPLSASNAIIMNCFSGGGATGMATNCVDSLNNTNWTFIAPNTKLWTFGAGDSNWNTAANWTPAGVPGAGDSVVFNTGNIYNANCNLNANASVRAIQFTYAYMGKFNFMDKTLTISGNADIESSGDIVPGTGTINLAGTGNQSLLGRTGDTLPSIVHSGSGYCTIGQSGGPYRFNAVKISATNGDVTISQAFTVDSINVGSGANLHFDNTYTREDTIKSLSGTGNLSLGWADLWISGDLNLAGLNHLSPENAQIKFIGPNAKTFIPRSDTVLTAVEQINGTTNVSYYGMVVHNLTLTGGTFNLGTGLSDTIITQLYGGAGALDFGSSTLNLEAYMTDFTSVNFTIGAGTLAFCGPNPQQFTPRPGVLHPDIVQNGYNGTIIFNNALKAKSLTISQGSFTFSHTDSLRDSVGSLIVTTGGANPSIALGKDTLDISGAVNLSGLTNFMWVNPGVVRFTGSAPQPFMTPFSYNPTGFWCPPIIHNGGGTITQAGLLKCESFLQTAGAYNINGAIDSIMGLTIGDFTIANGTGSSITGLGNSTIAVKYGNASFAGQSTANMLNLSPASLWTLSVPTMSKTITAQYAIVGNCKAVTYAGLMAQPQYCAMAPGDSNWNMAAVMPQMYDTVGTANSIVASQRPDNSDTVDIWYKLQDPDNAIDTIKMTFRNRISGTWTVPVNGTIVGDVGPVASNNVSVRRHVRWSVLGQFGNTFASDSLQIGLTAQDNFGNTTPIIMTAANVKIMTDVIPPISAVTFPANKAYVNGLTTISGSASDSGRGVKLVEIALKNTAAGSYWNGTSAWTGVVTWLPTTYNPPNAWVFNNGSAALANGLTIVVMSRATDSANNVQIFYGTDTVFVDTIAPVSTVTYPINNSSISSLVSISGTATDAGAGIASVIICIKNEIDTMYWTEGNGWIKTQAWLQSTGTVSWTYAAPALTNGKKYTVQSKAIDRANNMEVPGTGVTFLYSSTAPGSPTIAITNRQKYTNSAVVSLTLSVQNADSMQFKANAGPWSAWEPYTTTKSNMNIATGMQGVMRIFVEYKDRYGNMTAPVSDSTIYDTIPPACAISTVGVINPVTWSHVISGVSSDALSGVKTVSVRVRNRTTNMYWNGAAWVIDSTLATWITATGTTVWNCSLALAGMNSGPYLIQACALDSAGNKGLAIDSLQLIPSPGAPQITINKTNRFTNSPMVALTLSAQNVDSMQFHLDAGAWSAWEAYATAKANVAINPGGQGIRKVWVEYKNKIGNVTAPVSDSIVYDAIAPQCIVFTHGIFGPATWLGYFQGGSSDSLSGVKGVGVQIKCNLTGMFWNGTAWGADSSTAPASLVNGAWKFNLGATVMQPSVYVMKAFANDSAGNTGAATVDSINYAPAIVNNLNLAFTDMGDSAISVSWKVDKTKPFMKSVLYGYKYGKLPDTSMVVPLKYADSSFVIANVTKAGMWYFVTGLQDSAWNTSLPRYDSVAITNTPPVLTAPKDTVVFEDRLWQGRLVATDRNGDTVRCHIANLPAAFVIDSITGAMSWTPEYADVGRDTIIAVANDGHGGMARDTFVMTVLAVPPKIVFTGDTVAREDSLFLVHMQVTNLGKGDTATYTKKTLSSWMKLAGDTLAGVPGAADVGKDTIYLVASEKGGLSDTLQKIITVQHTNHAPKIKVWSRPDSMYQYSDTSWSFIATDADKGDSLAITWVTKPAWLAQTSCIVSGADRKFFLGGTPQAPDVKWARFSFAVHDTAGASFIISDSLFIVPLPTTVILKGKRQISYGAVKYVVSGTDYLDTALTFQTSLRSLDDTTALAMDKTTTGTVSFYPLIDGRYEFRAQAVDRQGLKDPKAPRDTLVISGATHHVFFDTTWNMMSIPNISVPVATIAGKGHMLHWDETGAEQDIYSYYKKPPDIVQMVPGMSYWRKSPDTVTVDLRRQDVRDTTMSIQLIKGEYGWNQIASPYPYPVKWSNSSVAWKWNSQTQDYEEADSVLEPWKGYWVVADSQATVRVDNTPVFTSATLAKKQSVYFAGKSDWQLKVKLTTGKGMDAENKIGFNRLAQDGFDRLDFPKAPRFQGGRYMFFPHADWNRPIKEFASDIRNTMQHINVFQIGIAPSKADTGGSQLSIDGTENLSSVYCFLVDPYSVTAISSGKQYPVASSGSVLYKQIFVTDDKNFIRNFPRVFSLANPYPNPCRPTTNINYVLPYNFANDGLLSLEPYQVKIALYDAMGRQVRELVYHKQLPGMYHIVWDGKNNSERIAASGTYFCRLEAGKYSATTRLVMIK